MMIRMFYCMSAFSIIQYFTVTRHKISGALGVVISYIDPINLGM
jgi:hypothetical protein